MPIKPVMNAEGMKTLGQAKRKMHETPKMKKSEPYKRGKKNKTDS